MNFFERFGGVALFGGILCYFFAGSIIVLAPAVLTNADDPVVIDIYGNEVPVPAYSEEELSGREVYQKQVCWHCHSQFVRPVNDENLRWGPVSQAGESVIDTPHLFSTRRIGPDLAREGWRRVDDWHIAHLFNPRYTIKDSVMPAFTWLFKRYTFDDEITGLIENLDSNGDGIVSPKPDWDSREFWPDADAYLKEIKAARIDNSGVLQPVDEDGTPYKQKATGEDLWAREDGTRPYDAYDAWRVVNRGDNLLTLYDARRRATPEALDLVRYLQRLGIAIGPWRKPVVFGTPTRGYRPPMRGVTAEYTYMGQNDSGDWVEMTGETSVEDGQMPQRDSMARRYGFSRSRATQAALYESERYEREYDALMKAWLEQNPEWERRFERGKELYDRNCASCHGDEGRGNGDAAEFLLVRPRDFTVAKYRYRSTKSGNMPLDGDLFRSLYRGLNGSSMPPWNNMPSDHLWLLVDYIKTFKESTGGDRGKPWDQESKAVTIPSPPTIAADEYDDLLQRGKAVYVAMNCSNCHGTTGRGDGPGWDETSKDNGGVVRPRDFTSRGPTDSGWDHDIPELRYRGGATAQDIYRTIVAGLDGTGMPASDFETKFEQTEELERLKASGAPQMKIDAAAKAARQKLVVPLKEDLPGVIQTTDENGNYAEYVEYLKRTKPKRGGKYDVGDDWALVLYVMNLSGIPWPDIKE